MKLREDSKYFTSPHFFYRILNIRTYLSLPVVLYGNQIGFLLEEMNEIYEESVKKKFVLKLWNKIKSYVMKIFTVFNPHR